jgi:hypothetical protein
LLGWVSLATKDPASRLIEIQHGHTEILNWYQKSAGGQVFRKSVATVVEQPASLPRNASGVQYDLFFPSGLQNTSCSGDQFT